MEFRPDVHTARWFAIGVAIAAVLVLLVGLVLTQTRTGQGLVLGWTVGAVQGTMKGTLEVDRLRGNLIRGATVHGVEIRDETGDLFLRADSAQVAYGFRSILRLRMFFRHIILYRPEVELVRMPDSEQWNFQQIFGDTVDRPDREPSATLLDLVELHDADLYIRTPWDPAADTPEARAEKIREALEPDSRSVVREVPGGFLQTISIQGASGRFRDIQVAPDELGGTFAQVDRFSGRIHVWREPLRVEALRGEVAIFDETMEFRAPQVRLPDSEIEGYGRIRFEDANAVDITLASEDVALRDLQWLYPPLPDEGGGRLTLKIETRPDGILYFADDIDLSVPGTRVRGKFGILIGDSLEFVEPELVADPLDVGTIERLLPVELPVTDLRIRRATVREADS